MSVDQEDFKMNRSFINRQDHCENADWKTKDNEHSAEKGWCYIRSIAAEILLVIGHSLFSAYLRHKVLHSGNCFFQFVLVEISHHDRLNDDHSAYTEAER